MNPPRSAPPHFRNFSDIQIEATIFGQFLRIGIFENVESFRVRLHQSVLDAVMHHFYEVAGTGGSGVNETLVRCGFLSFRE